MCDDILVRVTVINRGPDPASLHLAAHALVPQYLELGLRHAAPGVGTPGFALPSGSREQTLGEFKLWLEDAPPLLFTENESNTKRLWNYDGGQPTPKMRFTAT